MNIDLTREEIEAVLGWSANPETMSGPALTAHGKLYLAATDRGLESVRERQRLSLFQQAWDRHHKRDGKVFQVVLQTVIGKAEKIDWTRFQANHTPFCDYWDRHGWQFCPETLMSWIDNGCNPPPPEAQRETRADRIGNRE